MEDDAEETGTVSRSRGLLARKYCAPFRPTLSALTQVNVLPLRVATLMLRRRTVF